MVEDDFEMDIEEPLGNEFYREERVLGRSFKQGFGFALGMIFAILIMALLLSLLAYLAVDGGYTTWNELLLLE